MTEEKKDIEDNKIPKEVNEAKKKGYDIFILEGGNGITLYVRKPSPVEIKQFFDEVAGDKGKLGSRMEKIVRNCLIYPSMTEYETILKDKPGLFVSIYNSIQAEIGLDETFLSRKL
jgi:hypothetical protein